MVSRLLLLWFALALLAGATALINTTWAISLLWGCSVSLLPSVCFAWYSFRKRYRAGQALAVVHAFYRAEAIKFLLTAAMFAAVLARVDMIHLPVFFLAFIGAQMSSWWLTARVLNRPQQ